jgi:hypothetical protein
VVVANTDAHPAAHVGRASQVRYDYDMAIYGRDAWDELVERGLGIVIDPLVFRLGQFFLEGAPLAEDEKNRRWSAIESDIGALVSFFDLVVLHGQLPAFNYHDTYFDWRVEGDRLGAVMNTPGDKTIVHVDVEHHMYRAAKKAALDQLDKRLAEGSLAPRATSDAILKTLEAVGYEWEPSIEALESKLANPDQVRLARFLLGLLVFAGYAQQTGAPHVLAPKRSRMLAEVGLGAEQPPAESESAVYAELRRRFRDAGEGWRDDELPWTPSFLPFLLQGTKDRYREGPDVLLARAKELRGKKSVQDYRELRAALLSEDAERSGKARMELDAAASAVASSLSSNKKELEVSRNLIVEVLPRALGAVGGALVGTLLAGPPGTIAGGLVGVVGEEALRPAQTRLWGWFLDELPFRSARKLLSRSVRADYDLREELLPGLRTVWETGRRPG